MVGTADAWHGDIEDAVRETGAVADQEGWAWRRVNRGRRAGNRKKKVPGAKLHKAGFGEAMAQGPRSWRQGAVCVLKPRAQVSHWCLFLHFGFSYTIFLCSHLFLEDQSDPGTEKPRFRGLGEVAVPPRSSSSSSAGTKQLAMPGSNRRTAEGRAPVGQVPPSTLGHSDGNLGVSADCSSGGRSSCIGNDS